MLLVKIMVMRADVLTEAKVKPVCMVHAFVQGVLFLF